MNTETQPTPTAAELLAEWKRLQLIDPDYGHLPNGEAHLQNSIDDMLMTNIAAQLNQSCEDAGISINDDWVFAYASEKMVWALGYGGGYRFMNIDAREQQALQEWLLIKAQAQ